MDLAPFPQAITVIMATSLPSLRLFSLCTAGTLQALLILASGEEGREVKAFFIIIFQWVRDIVVAQPKVFKKIVNQMFTLEILKAVGQVFKT